ncbi:hypothetical protein BG22_06265 [Bifidobacterium sp. UTBIF-78]|nr:hypothetical protein BG22_06265 [Bifidobacterium sp. UTBIF-78]
MMALDPSCRLMPRDRAMARGYLACEGYIGGFSGTYLLCKGYVECGIASTNVAIAPSIHGVQAMRYPLQSRYVPAEALMYPLQRR